jgi:hypothetical protein
LKTLHGAPSKKGLNAGAPAFNPFLELSQKISATNPLNHTSEKKHNYIFKK